MRDEQAQVYAERGWCDGGLQRPGVQEVGAPVHELPVPQGGGLWELVRALLPQLSEVDAAEVCGSRVQQAGAGEVVGVVWQGGWVSGGSMRWLVVVQIAMGQMSEYRTCSIHGDKEWDRYYYFSDMDPRGLQKRRNKFSVELAAAGYKVRGRLGVGCWV